MWRVYGLFISLVATNLYALPFEVVPFVGLPTSVPSGGTTTAYYQVTNKTEITRPNNYVAYFPTNVSQITGGVGVCGSSFSLASGASCLLQLLISGPVTNSSSNFEEHLFVCAEDGLLCAGPTPANSLNVTQGAVIDYMTTIGVGDINYAYYSLDSGVNWSAAAMNPDTTGFTDVFLEGLSCGSDSTTCVAVGAGQQGSQNGIAFYSYNYGNSWHVANSQPYLTSPNAVAASAVSCSSSASYCVMVGTNNQAPTLPFSYYSTDNGQNWTPSSTTFTHVGGSGSTTLVSISCSSDGQICSAVGRSNSGSLGLSYYTTNGGVNWILSSTLPPVPASSSSIFLNSVSCNSSGLNCAAVGTYISSVGGAHAVTLGYYTTNGGVDWQRSGDMTPPVPSGNNRMFSVSCSANDGLTCAAVGQYISTNSPLTFYSVDGGQTWTLSPTLPSSGFGGVQSVFCSELACSALPGNLSGASWYSSDGGVNWATATTPPPGSSTVQTGTISGD